MLLVSTFLTLFLTKLIPLGRVLALYFLRTSSLPGIFFFFFLRSGTDPDIVNAACPNAEPAAEKKPQCISGECVSSGPLAAPSTRLTRDLWNNFWSHTLNNTLSAGKGKILWSSQSWVRPPLCEMNVIKASFFSVGFTWGSASILYVRAGWQKEASSSQLYSPGIQPLHIGVGGDDKYWHFASSGDIE